MVVINTQNRIKINHFVEVPNAECTIATASDEYNKLKLFLIVNGEDTIYKRNGINDTWDKLDSDSHNTVRKLVKDALADSSVPCYSTDGLSILN